MLRSLVIVVVSFTLGSVSFALPLPGDPAPPLSLAEFINAPAGTPKTLDDLKGKVVVLEFWATWCAPCAAAIPHLNAINEEFAGNDGVVFLAITDESSDTIAEFLEHNAVRSSVARDDGGKTLRAYGVRTIPQTIVINPEGVIVGVLYPTDLTRDRLRGYIRGQMDLRQDFGTAQREERRSSYEELSKSVGSLVPGVDPLSSVPTIVPEFQILLRKNPYATGLGGFSNLGLTLTKVTPRDVLARVSGLSPGQIEFPAERPASDEEYDLVVRWPTPNPDDSLRIAVARLAAQGLGYDANVVETTVSVLRLVRVPGSSITVKSVPPETRGLGVRFSPTQFGAENGAVISSLVPVFQHLLGRVVRDETGLEGMFLFPEIQFDADSVASVNASMRAAYGLELVEADEVMKVLRLTPLSP